MMIENQWKHALKYTVILRYIHNTRSQTRNNRNGNKLQSRKQKEESWE